MPTLEPALTPASPAPEPAAADEPDEELVAAAAQLASLAPGWERALHLAAAQLSTPEVLAGARAVSLFLAEVQSCIRAGWNLDLTAAFCRQRLARGPGYLADVAVRPSELFDGADWQQQRQETLRAGGSVALRSLSAGPAARLEVAQELLEGGAWWDRAGTVEGAKAWLQRALDNRGRRWRRGETTRLGRGHVASLDAPLDVNGDDGDSIPPQVPAFYSALGAVVEEAPLHLELLQGLFARLKPEARPVVALHLQGFPWAEAGKEAGVDELATERAKRAWNRVLVAFRKKFPDYASWLSRNA